MKIQTHYICQTNQYGETYRISYNSWGHPESSRVLLCVHGLNRNSRDFDFIAENLLEHDYYIVAPDLPGRGNSDYLKDYRGYSLESNVADLQSIINQLELSNIDLVGVSLGGVLGMLLASLPDKSIRRLILDDVGAEIEMAGIARIANYSKEQPDFGTFVEACAYLEKHSCADGIYDEEILKHMCINSFHRNTAKRWELKRDVKLALCLTEGLAGQNNIQFWEQWARITVQTLIIYGEQSDLLTRETIKKMQQINSLTEVLTVPDAGHAPYLYRKEHLEKITRFLLQ